MRRSFGIAFIALGAAGGAAGPAAAATAPAPIEVARLAFPQSSGADALVDRAGNLHVVFRDSRRSDNGAIFRYARRAAAGGKAAESPVPIIEPGGFLDVPFLYQLPASDLRILATGSGQNRLFAATSADAGKTWAAADTSAFPGSPQLIPNFAAITDAPGGALTAGYTAGANSLVRLRDDLTGFDVVTNPYVFPDQSQPRALAVAADGTAFGATPGSSQGNAQVLAGATAVTVPHAACATEGFLSADIAAGASSAVLLTSGCHGTWARPVSAAGVVGAAVKLGTAPVSGGLADVGRAPDGSYTAVWQDESGDLGVARSTNGTTWKVAKGLLPVSERNAQVDGRLSRGTPSWFAWTDSFATSAGAKKSVVRALKVTSTYTLPTVSAKGVPNARIGRHGSLAIAMPRKIARGGLAQTGVIPLRLAVAIPDTVTVNIRITRQISGNATLSVATFNGKVRVVPGKPKAVAAPMGTGGFSIGIGGGSGGGGGGGPKLPEVRKGDAITYDVLTRNGEVSFEAIVS